MTTEIELTNVPSMKFSDLGAGTAFVYNGGIFIRSYSEEEGIFIRMLDEIKDIQPTAIARAEWIPWAAVEFNNPECWVRVVRRSKLTVEL